MKNALIGVGIAIALVLAFMGSFRLLVRHIYNRQDCERFNIDNIELRTGINIPAVSEFECNCEANHKTSKFTINTKEVELDQYIDDNEFELVNDQYFKEGDNKNTKWKASLDEATAELVVNIEYRK